jgi:hypothetical protein
MSPSTGGRLDQRTPELAASSASPPAAASPRLGRAVESSVRDALDSGWRNSLACPLERARLIGLRDLSVNARSLFVRVLGQLPLRQPLLNDVYYFARNRRVAVIVSTPTPFYATHQ